MRQIIVCIHPEQLLPDLGGGVVLAVIKEHTGLVNHRSELRGPEYLDIFAAGIQHIDIAVGPNRHRRRIVEVAILAILLATEDIEQVSRLVVLINLSRSSVQGSDDTGVIHRNGHKLRELPVAKGLLTEESLRGVVGKAKQVAVVGNFVDVLTQRVELLDLPHLCRGRYRVDVPVTAQIHVRVGARQRLRNLRLLLRSGEEARKHGGQTEQVVVSPEEAPECPGSVHLDDAPEVPTAVHNKDAPAWIHDHLGWLVAGVRLQQFRSRLPIGAEKLAGLIKNSNSAIPRVGNVDRAVGGHVQPLRSVEGRRRFRRFGVRLPDHTQELVVLIQLDQPIVVGISDPQVLIRRVKVHVRRVLHRQRRRVLQGRQQRDLVVVHIGNRRRITPKTRRWVNGIAPPQIRRRCQRQRQAEQRRQHPAHDGPLHPPLQHHAVSSRRIIIP